MEVVHKKKNKTKRKVYTYQEAYDASLQYFSGDALAAKVWVDKYCLKNTVKGEVQYYELTPNDMHLRLAKEFARIESKYPNPLTEKEIFDVLDGFNWIIPQGSPMAGIGNKFANSSISNCFVIGNYPDSYGGIMAEDQDQVQLMKRRAGVGSDISYLRPSGAIVGTMPMEDGGLTLFMERYSNSTREVAQDGRRGARMLSIDVKHPDAEKFVDKKMTPGSVTGANVSVRITDHFMRCKEFNLPFYQIFPIDLDIQDVIPSGTELEKKILLRELEYNKLYQGKVINGTQTYYKKIDPVQLWAKLVYNAWRSAEPGVLFWDTIRNESPAAFYGPKWREQSTNPCVTGDTLVAVADEREFVSFKELAEIGKDVDVYSESINGVICVKKMRLPRVTSRNEQIYKVSFKGRDNHFIRGTAQHEFYLLNNKKVELKDLKPGMVIRVIKKVKASDSKKSGIFNRSTSQQKLPTFTVESIEKDGIEDVYNGTVDDFHNYFVGNFEVSEDATISAKLANCGEIPLPPGDSCRLLLLNLYGYISNKFTKEAVFEDNLFEQHVNIAMRLMDDIVDLEIEKIDLILKEIKAKKMDPKFKRSEIELWERIRKMAQDGRRTGLGITGEGDMIAALGIKYGTPEATEFASKLHQLLATEAYKASVELAEERGHFPIWDINDIESSGFLTRMFSLENELMDQTTMEKAAKFGRRNIALLTIAPAGSVSILSQTSSGVEPIFAPWYFRKKKITTETEWDFVDENGDKWVEFPVFHYPFIEWFASQGPVTFEVAKEFLEKQKQETLQEFFIKSPYYGATAQDTDYVEKVRMQGAIQKWVDHSISVTVNMPEDVTEEVVAAVYQQAYKSGCKGVTVYRDNSRGNVLATHSVKDKVSEELEYQDGIRRPEEVECDVHYKNIKGEQFLVFVGLVGNKPFEIFSVPFKYNESGPKILKGKIIKNGDKTYDFMSDEGEILKDLSSKMIENESNTTRSLSMLLRHRVNPKFIIHSMDKFTTVGSFHTVIKQVLQTYVSSEDLKKGDCPNCGGELIRTGGCTECKDCGYSGCS